MDYKSSEQTIAWFKDRYLEENLEIKPPYQRRPVWTVKQKSNLIESILMRLPNPILQFIEVEQEEGEKEYNRFSLEYLEPDSSWRGQTFDGLTGEQKQTFFGHSLAVRFLSNATESEVRDMFKRLNKYLTS